MERIPVVFTQKLSSIMKYSFYFRITEEKYSTDFGYILQDLEEYYFYSIVPNPKLTSEFKVKNLYSTNITNSSSPLSVENDDKELITFSLKMDNPWRHYHCSFYTGQRFFYGNKWSFSRMEDV